MINYIVIIAVKNIYKSKTLANLQEKMKLQDIKFYQKMSIFKKFSNNLLHKLHLEMFPVIFYRNQFVYHERDSADMIYFVQSGELKVIFM